MVRAFYTDPMCGDCCHFNKEKKWCNWWNTFTFRDSCACDFAQDNETWIEPELINTKEIDCGYIWNRKEGRLMEVVE